MAEPDAGPHHGTAIRTHYDPKLHATELWKMR